MYEDDTDYGALFGVTPDAEGQESAQDPEEQEGAGAEETEPEGQGAAGGPEGQEPAQKPEGQEEPEGREPQPDDRQMELSPEAEAEQSGLRADDAQAKVRYEAAAAKAREEAQRAVDKTFARIGLRDPYTGQPITSEAEYDAYRDRFGAERRDQMLKRSGMSSEEFQQFVQDLPEVRKAREAQEAAEKAQREAREAAAKVKIEQQLREIGALDPSIRSLEDLGKMPTYPRFYELVQRGNTFTDAFKLANFDALSQRAAAGARQAAVNAARGKEHLEQTRTRGKGAVSIPAEVREQYKFFNPDVSDDEILRHYQKNHREA